jgi:arginine-tRNA-protein transferase
MVSNGQFHTELKTCPYLHDRPSRLEVHLVAALRPVEHGALLSAGVRHFGRSYFRPACPDCSRCVSIRVPVRRFRPSRSQRRVLARNRDVTVEIGEPGVDEDRLDLYRRFHAERERRRDWAPSEMDFEEYVSSFVDNPITTLELRYRIEGRLVAIAYADESPAALNSIFGFWDPDCFRRGLGTFDVLVEIGEALARGKEHLYLGYHVLGCPSLEYKKGFRPCEILVGGRWVGEEDFKEGAKDPCAS